MHRIIGLKVLRHFVLLLIFWYNVIDIVFLCQLLVLVLTCVRFLDQWAKVSLHGRSAVAGSIGCPHGPILPCVPIDPFCSINVFGGVPVCYRL